MGVTVLGRQRPEGGLDLPHSLVVPADHEAIADLEPPDTA